MRKVTYVLKVGGAALTDKKAGRSFVSKVSECVAADIRKGTRIIIVHGAGYGAHRFVRSRGMRSVADNQADWARLRRNVSRITATLIDSLIDHGHAAIELSVPSMVRTNAGRITGFDLYPVKAYLDMGFVPIMHSDAPPDSKYGVSVLSGDDIAVYLANRLRAKALIFGIDIDGIRSADGSILKSVKKQNVGKLYTWDVNDVTGGMKKKLTEIGKLNPGTSAYIISLRKRGSLSKVLYGMGAGTKVH